MRAQATVSRRTGRSMNPALPIVLRVLLALLLAVLATRPLHADDGNTSVQAPIPVQTRIIVQSGHSAPISAAAWMPDGKFVLTGSTDGQLLVWDLAGRVVSRTQLGTRGYRTIVERIVANPDGRGAMVDEIQFRDMYDNGVASEVHRRHYAVVFGQDRVEPLQDEQIDPPWSSEQSFYEGSLTLKSRLMAQGQWPASKLGWTLLWRDGQLTLQSPGSAAPIVLRGTLGYAPDEGDARMEVRARKLETLAGAIQRNAALSVKCAGNKRCERKEQPNDVNGMLQSLDSADASVSQRPLLSPDGSRLAWIDRNGQGASGWRLGILDLMIGRTVSLPFEGAADLARIGWSGETRITVRNADATYSVDADKPVPSPQIASMCLAGGSDDLARDAAAGCAPPANGAGSRRTLTLVAEHGLVRVADAASGRAVCTAFIDEGEVIRAALALASADLRWILLQSAQGYTELFHVTDAALANSMKNDASGERRQVRCAAPAAFQADPGRVGFHPRLPLLWVEGRGGRIDFYRTSAISAASDSNPLGTPLFTLFRLPSGRFFAIDAEGRYDTNLPPDTDAVRWTVSDAPLQSLAPQTFMRDYYQPGLMRRLLECVSDGVANCSARFPAIRSLATLNRVLPKVRIVEIKPGKTPDVAIVSVEVEDGFEPDAVNGKTATGVYDVRVFRNGKLELHHPEQVFEEMFERQAKANTLTSEQRMALTQAERGEANPELVAENLRSDLGYWRKYSQVWKDPVRGYPRLDFTIPLPTIAGSEESEFSVYAFNEDRVKSETVSAKFRRPPVAPRKPRAFVISIGIDAYDSPRLQLNFAASDAELIGDRLARIPGYEVHRITLAGKRLPNGKTSRFTRLDFDAMFSSMGRHDIPVIIQKLGEDGFDASQLDHPNADDILILTFSGHGWADRQGNFYLLPSDAVWPEGADAPNTSTLISSENLAMVMGYFHVSEIAMIIDACHSAASVDAGGFRPGPMGDAGLGQLAFDKGIRILAATQAGDVALEDPTLRQGLLTFALAGEGITQTGGKADSDGDGRITLDEWLAYGARRMPSLIAELGVRHVAAGGDRSRGWIPSTTQSASGGQEPALFDFNKVPSKIVLREAVLP